MKIVKREQDHIVIVEIEGSLSSEEKIAFEREINGILEREMNVILDLSKVTFIDSATLGSIVKYYALFHARDRHLLLASVNPQIYEVMQLTGITQQVRLFESPHGAIEFIRGT